MISPRVAEGLRGRGYDVVATAERETLGSSDARQLAEAIQEGRALVTFDVRGFSVLAKAAAVAGTEHWGIVFLSPARFSRSSSFSRPESGRAAPRPARSGAPRPRPPSPG